MPGARGAIGLVRLETVFFILWRWMRAHPISELLAMVGIATGVALVFAVQVANTSGTSSVEQLSEGVAGDADLQLSSRRPQGFDQAVVEEVGRVGGVSVAAPLLELRVGLRGMRSRQPATLVGTDSRLARLGGELVQELAPPGLERVRGVAVSAPLAAAAGVRAGDQMVVEVRGRRVRVPVLTLLHESEFGPVATSAFVAAPIEYVQRLSGLAGRVSRVLVAAERGREAAVRGALEAIADDRLDVGPSDSEVTLVKQAARPNDQVTALFAGISGALGLLFAANAMLITVPQRRRFVAWLRLEGYENAAVVQTVVVEGLLLGLAGSALGLVGGDLLSRYVFEATPGYLSFAFAVGDERVVSAGAVVVAVGVGVAAGMLAAAGPLRDLLARRPIEGAVRDKASEGAGSHVSGRLALAIGGALLLITTGVLTLAPEAAILGLVALAGAVLFLIVALLDGTLRLLQSIARRAGRPMLMVASAELRAYPLRSWALAATGALAVFGSVAIGGAHRDLLRGLDDLNESFVSTADVWITAGGDENSLTSEPFPATPTQIARLSGNPAVRDVRIYRGGLRDMAGRRVWVIARPSRDRTFIPRRQLVDGNLETADGRLRAGGWVALSEVLAERFDVGIEDRIVLPTPAGPVSKRVAAIVTTFGWAPGVLLLNADDYARSWRTTDATALEVDLAGPASGQALQAVRGAVEPGSPLTVEAAAGRASRFKRLNRQSLARLGQIALLVSIAAALAIAAAMSNVLWQRRPRLAGLKLTGYSRRDVWCALLLETGIVLTVGCLLGGLAGLYGQALLAHALEVVTGFPVAHEIAVQLAAGTLVAVALLATTITAIPGWVAARVPPVMGFQD